MAMGSSLGLPDGVQAKFSSILFKETSEDHSEWYLTSVLGIQAYIQTCYTVIFRKKSVEISRNEMKWYH